MIHCTFNMHGQIALKKVKKDKTNKQKKKKIKSQQIASFIRLFFRSLTLSPQNTLDTNRRAPQNSGGTKSAEYRGRAVTVKPVGELSSPRSACWQDWNCLLRSKKRNRCGSIRRMCTLTHTEPSNQKTPFIWYWHKKSNRSASSSPGFAPTIVRSPSNWGETDISCHDLLTSCLHGLRKKLQKWLLVSI